MFYPRNDRQEYLVAMAAELADQFALRAVDQDRTGAFPYANFEAIRGTLLPRMVVPVELGGWGANLLETVMTVERLAVGDGSTALSITMHLQTLGSAAESSNWPQALFARICTDIVRRGALINACATEPELGSPSRGGKPKTTARLVDPALSSHDPAATWSISGRKSFASMAPVLDYLIIPASLEDGSGEVAHFVVPRSEGVEIVETWNAMGMRTTGSHDVVLRDVVVPNAN